MKTSSLPLYCLFLPFCPLMCVFQFSSLSASHPDLIFLSWHFSAQPTGIWKVYLTRWSPHPSGSHYRAFYEYVLKDGYFSVWCSTVSLLPRLFTQSFDLDENDYIPPMDVTFVSLHHLFTSRPCVAALQSKRIGAGSALFSVWHLNILGRNVQECVNCSYHPQLFPICICNCHMPWNGYIFPETITINLVKKQF